MQGSSKISVCLFVHWNKQNRLMPSDMHTIQALSSQVDRVILIQNIDSTEAKKVTVELPKNVQHVFRNNFGYDFGAYQDGILSLEKELKNISELYLCNNSIFTRQYSLKDLFLMCRKSNFQLLGLTESFEIEWHIQSYFLRFDETILSMNEFVSFWREIKPTNNKTETVKLYEVPLAAHFKSFEISVGALWPLEKFKLFLFTEFGNSFNHINPDGKGIKKAIKDLLNGRPLNPTHRLWAILLELNFPFIKKDLISGRVHEQLCQKNWRSYVTEPEIRALISQEI